MTGIILLSLIIVDEDVVDDNEVTDGIEEEGDGGGQKWLWCSRRQRRSGENGGSSWFS